MTHTFSLALPIKAASLRPLMKWSSILLLGVIALLVNACEKHPAAELPPEHATAYGEHGWSPKGGSKHGEAHPGAANRGEAKTAEVEQAKPAAKAEGAGAESPQFFPKEK